MVRIVPCSNVDAIRLPFFFFNATPTTQIYTLSLHDALPISSRISLRGRSAASLRQNRVTVFSFSKNHFSSPSGRWSIVLLISSWGSRSEERFSRNAETDLVCRLLLEKKKTTEITDEGKTTTT